MPATQPHTTIVRDCERLVPGHVELIPGPRGDVIVCLERAGRRIALCMPAAQARAVGAKLIAFAEGEGGSR